MERNKSFKERLDAIFKITETKYKSLNKNFGINFSSERIVLFQMINRNLLEHSKDTEFGYGIHLSFDDSFPETKGELERFKNADFAPQFDYHVWDEIAIYQLDLKTDKEQIRTIAEKVIKVVYEKEVAKVIIDEFEI